MAWKYAGYCIPDYFWKNLIAGVILVGLIYCHVPVETVRSWSPLLDSLEKYASYQCCFHQALLVARVPHVTEAYLPSRRSPLNYQHVNAHHIFYGVYHILHAALNCTSHAAFEWWSFKNKISRYYMGYHVLYIFCRFSFVLFVGSNPLGFLRQTHIF